MRKIIIILMLLSGLILIGCDNRCHEDSDCGIKEVCEFESPDDDEGSCKEKSCNQDCIIDAQVCKIGRCDRTTGFDCKYMAVSSDVRCSGSVEGKECYYHKCNEGQCIEYLSQQCLEDRELEKLVQEQGGHKDICDDGTISGQCSEARPGYLCYEGIYIKEDSCNTAAMAPTISPIFCDDGTPDGECSLDEIGSICKEGVLEADDACLPATNEEEGCQGTPEGECSPDGRWCVHGVLVEDEACANQCEDGTPNWGCSAYSIGYICEEGVLVREPACD